MNIKKGNIAYSLNLVWKADKGYVIWTMVRNIFNSVYGVYLFVYMTKYILTCIEEQRPFSELLTYIAIICAGHVLVHIVCASHEYYKKRYSPVVYRNIFSSIISVSSQMEYKRFEQPDFYDKFSRALDASVDRCLQMLDDLAWFIGAVVGVIITLELVVRVDSLLLLFIILPVITNIIFGNKMSKLYYDMDVETTRDSRILNYTKRVFYEKKYAGEIRLYGIKNALFKYHKNSTDSKYKTVKSFRTKIGTLEAASNVIFNIMCNIAPMIYIAIWVKGDSNVQVGAYIAVALTALGSITGRMQWCVGLVTDMRKNSLFIQNLRDFLEYKPEKIKQKTTPVPETLDNIEIKNLEFTYTGADKPTLYDINLSIKRGTRIALVGHNGAGKTTLVKLIMGLYEATGGEIKSGGTNINEYDSKLYRSHFGTVFQDLQVFSVSIAENVLARRPQNSSDRKLVIDSLEKAQFGDDLNKLPNGIDTIVTREYDDNGMVPSGGQAQKIAIARVFAKNPDIVILDEPSSALDPIAEFYMYENMLRLSENKSVIFISHRLSSARLADKIYMLENGTIIEQGTHDELMLLNGKYSEMFKLQAQNYQESLPDEMEEMLNEKAKKSR